jgi:hypothetical protein
MTDAEFQDAIEPYLARLAREINVRFAILAELDGSSVESQVESCLLGLRMAQLVEGKKF